MPISENIDRVQRAIDELWRIAGLERPTSAPSATKTGRGRGGKRPGAGRKPIGDRAMTMGERQRRHRAAKAVV